MLQKCRLSYKCGKSFYCTATVASRLDSFRTAENNPLHHNESHIGRYYSLSLADRDKLFSTGGLPKMFEIQAETFNEYCLMVRQPAIEIMKCMKHLRDDKSVTRFVLYGKMGCGKSLTLAHLIHYAHKDGRLIVHIPWLGNWMRRCKERSNTENKEGYMDLNLDAAAWLLHFKEQNSQFVDSRLTTKTYVWNKRESSEVGITWTDLINYGVNRIKYATQCIEALANEIKRAATNDELKVFVAVDGFNAFFYEKTRVFGDKKESIPPSRITITQPFLDLTHFNWRNAVVVVTVDAIANGMQDEPHYLPRYLLGKEGFEHLDPFVPVSVAEYTDKELKSCMDYYRERRWVTPFEGQDDELAFISARNPFKLMQTCDAL